MYYYADHFRHDNNFYTNNVKREALETACERLSPCLTKDNGMKTRFTQSV